MGQKIHPTGFRLPVTRNWASRWYASNRQFGALFGLAPEQLVSGVALKALPVLIIGGFTSVPGVIVAGLIVGAVEKVVEVYIGPYFGGGIEGWFPYVLALLFLLVPKSVHDFWQQVAPLWQRIWPKRARAG